MKSIDLDAEAGVSLTISAALCRGLIEVDNFAAALFTTDADFRGFMPRPH